MGPFINFLVMNLRIVAYSFDRRGAIELPSSNHCPYEIPKYVLKKTVCIIFLQSSDRYIRLVMSVISKWVEFRSGLNVMLVAR